MIKLIIADDHQLVIDGIRLMIAEAPDMECVGTANDGQEALALLAKKQADVLLLDINMEGLNGLETCRAVHIRHPEVKMVALSMLKEPGLIKQMLKNGASGYLLKDAGMDEVLRAVRAVHAGKQYFSPEVSAAVMASLSASRTTEKKMLFPELTRRERQVLRLIDNQIGFALTFPTERSELTTEGRKPLRFGYSRERISIALIYNQ